MGTRSAIAIEREDGTILGAYCHWDGYLSSNGRILLEHYSDRKKLEKLLAQGDMSSLGPEIGRKHKFEDRHEPGGAASKGWTTFYKRDRGEDTPPTTCKDRTEFSATFSRSGAEYVYVFTKDDVWVYCERGAQFFGGSDGSPFSTWQPLTEELVKESVT